jgi:hypothetical protein
MNNKEIYDNIRAVPDYAKKQIDSGRMKGKTDISPMWRIETLTEVFGPCGIGWWYVIKDQRLQKGAGEEVKAFVDIDLYYKWGDTVSQPIPGIGGNTFIAKERNGLYTDDDCFKKALSDAISVAAKALGMGADVYMGCDPTKYTAIREPESTGNLPPIPQNPQSPPPPQRRQQAPQNPQPTPYFTCAHCGKKLVPYNDSNGRQVSLRAHAEKSMQLFGEVLCLDCMPK